MAELIKDVVKTSLGLEDPMLEDFVTSNFEILSEKVIDLLPGPKDSKGLDKIKKRIEEEKANAK